MDDDIKAHIAGIEQWIAASRDRQITSGLSNEERKQLHAVNRSIQQLSGLGVSIPDDLRNLKLKLATKDRETPEAGEARETLLEAVELVSALTKLTQAAKTLRDRLRTPDKGQLMKRRYEVTLKDLIECGHLSPNDKLELSWQKDGPVFEGAVRVDGTVAAKTHSGWKVFDSLSAAATCISERSSNGWLHWRRINSDGSRTILRDIRGKFMDQGR